MRNPVFVSLLLLPLQTNRTCCAVRPAKLSYASNSDVISRTAISSYTPYCSLSFVLFTSDHTARLASILHAERSVIFVHTSFFTSMCCEVVLSPPLLTNPFIPSYLHYSHPTPYSLLTSHLFCCRHFTQHQQHCTLHIAQIGTFRYKRHHS